MPGWLTDVARQLLDARLAVPLDELVRVAGVHEELGTADGRQLVSMLRDQGYLERALELAVVLARRTGDEERDPAAARVRGQLRFLRGEVSQGVIPPDSTFEPEAGRVLHVAGASLPFVDSSYTQRTHALALRGAELGLQARVVSQMGVGGASGYRVDVLDGVEYHRIPGPARGSSAADDWFALYVKRLAAVVRKVRPVALVPSSDFVNGLAALAVARAYGLTLVYDVRGAWEDSWLRRQREVYGWTEDLVPGTWGMPDLWSLRRSREAEVLCAADTVIANSDETAQHAIELGARVDAVFVVADGVDAGYRYVDALEWAGALERGTAQLARLGERRPAADELRRLLCAAPPRPLDRTSTTGVAGSAQAIRDRGWVLGALPPVLLDLPFDWRTACQENRSQAFHLHAWDFAVPFLRAWAEKRDEGALRWCLDRALSWCETFVDGDAQGTMAWYDMAIGLRSPRLAYLVREALEIGVDDGQLELLGAAVVRHQQEIFAARAYNPRTNHGFYTAVGEVSFARRLVTLPGMDVVLAQGQARLTEIATRQFAEDGGHREHSPDYHRMVLESFLDAVDDGLIDDPQLLERLDRAEQVMGWFIRPDRTIVQIGDSPATAVSAGSRTMRSPRTLFLATGGAHGEPNPRELMVLPDSGYAIVRSPQPRGVNDHLSAGYVTLMGAFHSRAHKHCDDLSLTWFDAGTEVLIDSGRFGYLDQLPADSPARDEGFFYGRPERQYVETTRAHNTVEVDGGNHRRRGRAPYGSAIRECEERDGFFRLVGAVDHESWQHVRAVTYRPGKWLLVEDGVTFPDSDEHLVRAWWNLPDSLLDPREEADGVSFALPEGGGRLSLRSMDGASVIAPVKGQEEPLRGWRSAADYSFTPAWSVALEARVTRAHRLTTLLTLDGTRPDAAPVSPFDLFATTPEGD
ncbi:heparinase II/III family protein [Cellulomonas sp. zg-ZUI22]|uniref:heparinase II/III domain-containing protein n=1 Tax=Cellulomonas sp. zg-ZUI22 TaxID=2816955 RepID=UPI001A943405|nr:heparinase II/III family protein [Cellulomonas sp. zg-ZUI22]MBO0901204.1 heparinase II/III family protein [Cellulomonas sp. zg-ZUI22]